MNTSAIINEIKNLPYPKKPSNPKHTLKVADYPSKSDYYKDFSLKMAEYDDQIAQHKADVNEYRLKVSDLENKFKSAALLECGIDHLPTAVQDATYKKAYEDGHSSGMGEVLLQLEDISDLVLLAYNAGVLV